MEQVIQYLKKESFKKYVRSGWKGGDPWKANENELGQVFASVFTSAFSP